MKALVTGATGFLGRHLVASLRRDGHGVTALSSKDADLTDGASLERFSEPFDVIWHLAGWTQAGDFCLRHPAEQWVINQRINTNVLDWWHRLQPQAKLVAIGTSCSYAPGESLVEERYLIGEPVPELYAYGMTKRMLLVGLRSMTAQYGHRWLYLVPSTLFGAGYHDPHKQRHFIFDVIDKILAAKREGTPVVLWGDGHQCRELVFVDDFVRAARLLVDTVDGEVVNVGSGEERSIRWYASQVSALVGYDANRIQYDTTRYVGVRSKQLSIGKLRGLLPGFQLTPLAAALEQTVLDYARASDPETVR
jgi:GDP-L-fucose synthase